MLLVCNEYWIDLDFVSVRLLWLFEIVFGFDICFASVSNRTGCITTDLNTGKFMCLSLDLKVERITRTYVSFKAIYIE